MASPSLFILYVLLLAACCPSIVSGLRSPALLRRSLVKLQATAQPPSAPRDVFIQKLVNSAKTISLAAATTLLVAPNRSNAAEGEVVDLEEITNKVFFDMAVNGKPAGRITIGLFGKTVPFTAKNFLEIAKGFKKDEKSTLLTYAGSPFHRVIPSFMCQGGDITRGDGRGGLSIYGRNFKDENFKIANKQFYVSMANSGPDTNGSQFFVITREGGTPWLNGKHVVFGRVIEGTELVKQIEALGSQSGTPSALVTISASGEVV